MLIVEDEFSVRWVIADYLRQAGHLVIAVPSAANAIAAFTYGAHINLAFIDFKLPGGLNGVMLAKWLDVHRPEIPVLLTSAHVDDTINADRHAQLPILCSGRQKAPTFGGSPHTNGREDHARAKRRTVRASS